MNWGVDVINQHGVRTCIERDLLDQVRAAGGKLVDPRQRRGDGPVLVDLHSCGIGDCVAALPAVRWLASPGEGLEFKVWVWCPAKCAFMFRDLADRVVTGAGDDDEPDGWGLKLDCAAAVQQAGLHTNDSYCQVSVFCDLAGVNPATPYLPVDPGLVDAIRKEGRRPLVLLHPVSSSKHKDWSLLNWAALGAWLQDRAEARVAYFHSDHVDWPARCRSVSSMRGLVGIEVEAVAAWVAAADLVVGGDSCAFHLAAAVGTPAIGLFGPTDGQAMARYYPLAQVLQSPDPDDLDRIGIAQVEAHCFEELING